MTRRLSSYPMTSKAPKAGPQWDPTLRALLAAVFFGLATPASKVLLRNLDPLALAGWLYLGAALGVLPWALRRGGLRPPEDSRDRRLLVGAVILGGMLGPVALLVGLKLAAASSVSLWLNLELMATAVLGALFFKEHLTPRGWIAVAGVLFAGVVLAMGENQAGLLGASLVAAACLFWGVDNQLTSLIAGIGPAQTTFWKGLIAGLFNLTAAALLGIQTLWWGAIPLALGVGVVSYGASIALYIGAAREMGATRSQVVFASAPFFGLAASWGALNEPLGSRHLLAMALFGASIFLLIWDRRGHGHVHTHPALTHTHAHSHDDGHHTHTHPGLPAGLRHTHSHQHEEMTHSHPHWPDLHHRHAHDRAGEGDAATGSGKERG